jgi:two-component system phosphate regulon sensor histidine kinase PhoR
LRVAKQGLVPPAVVAGVTLVAWGIGGTGWALAALAAGAVLLVGWDLYQQARLVRWASDPSNLRVPDARGTWGVAFAALRRRTRLKSATQRELAYTIERFQNAAEALPDGMVVLDAGYRIRWANARAFPYLGVAFPGDRGQPIVNFMRQPELLHYLHQREWSDPLVVDSQRQPGVTLSIQLVPFGIEETLLITRDVSRIEAVARMRRDFIANVSHELKTPLTVVSGFVETMQDLDLEPRQRKRYLSLMQGQAKNMQRLVNDLLTLSALESEQNPPAEVAFAIVPMLLELSAEAKVLSRGQHAVSLSIGDAATVQGNREELASAFGNLVSNAVRYTIAGGSITLTWRVDEDGSGVFAVVDTGIGIAPEHVPRLTERFYRVDRSRSRATGGTGLGLAIVKHVLLRHQATLEITSTLGEGSTFAVRLPARRVRCVPPPDVAIGPEPQAANSEAPREAGS